MCLHSNSDDKHAPVLIHSRASRRQTLLGFGRLVSAALKLMMMSTSRTVPSLALIFFTGVYAVYSLFTPVLSCGYLMVA